MASQSYFSFKQFVVHQDRCAMKVCTDSCLFGAWLVEQLRLLRINYQSALDIGTGTGLLSMMLAQELDGNITGIDLDPAAVAQARENVAASPFNQRIEIFETRLQEFISTQLFDLVISNPPFFEGQLTSSDKRRNNAMHATELSTDELLDGMERFLAIDGWGALLMPAYRADDVKAKLFERNLFIHKEAIVCQTEKHEPFRLMWLFSRKAPESLQSECIHIKVEEVYSARFSGLLQCYYLHL
jgi:tRNA1Val (adenine37-N6)-methyltransferase